MRVEVELLAIERASEQPVCDADQPAAHQPEDERSGNLPRDRYEGRDCTLRDRVDVHAASPSAVRVLAPVDRDCVILERSPAI